jgi:hypothetical protein
MDGGSVNSWKRAVSFNGSLAFLCAPTSKPDGRTHAEWAGEWLRWTLSRPAPESPFMDPDARYCRLGESAPIYLLGSSARGTAVRFCTVPTGRSILLTPGSVLCLQQMNAGNEEGLRTCVESALPLISNVAVEIDGVPLRDLHKHRVVSDLVVFTLPLDNVFGLREGRYRGIVGGYFTIHALTTPGQHVVHLHDEVSDFDFVSDATYMISVGPHH